MDIFAHVLWTNVVYRKKYLEDKKNRFWAVFFGVAPDLVSFTPVFLFYFLYRFTHITILGQSRDWLLNGYSLNSYNYTHSLVIFAVAAILVAIIRRGSPYWPMFGWALHILIDIPSHQGFYETPFLFPLSSYRFTHGVPWSNTTYMMVNYSALAIAYIIIFLLWNRKSKSPEGK